MLDTISIVYTIITFIIITLIAAFMTLALNKETRGLLLQDEKDQAQNNYPMYGSIDNNENGSENPQENEVQ